MKDDKVFINVPMTPGLKARVLRAAKKQSTSLSSIVRQSLDAYLPAKSETAQNNAQ